MFIGCKSAVVQVILYVYRKQLCGQLIILVLLVNLLHAIIGVLKLSLVLDEVRVLLRFYLILICQVLILFCIIARLFSCVLGGTVLIALLLMFGKF